MNIEELIRENKGTIVDVRGREEFASGHVVGSQNFPLPDLEKDMDALLALKQPLILCCLSGGRSKVAQFVLEKKGIACCNAGGWTNVNFIKSQ